MCLQGARRQEALHALLIALLQRAMQAVEGAGRKQLLTAHGSMGGLRLCRGM